MGDWGWEEEEEEEECKGKSTPLNKWKLLTTNDIRDSHDWSLDDNQSQSREQKNEIPNLRPPFVIFEYLNKISTVVSLHECASKSISHMETPGGFG